MFNAISWKEFLSAIALLLGGYYLVISGWRGVLTKGEQKVPSIVLLLKIKNRDNFPMLRFNLFSS